MNILRKRSFEHHLRVHRAQPGVALGLTGGRTGFGCSSTAVVVVVVATAAVSWWRD